MRERLFSSSCRIILNMDGPNTDDVILDDCLTNALKFTVVSRCQDSYNDITLYHTVHRACGVRCDICINANEDFVVTNRMLRLISRYS